VLPGIIMVARIDGRGFTHLISENGTLHKKQFLSYRLRKKWISPHC
jgi:tRNA(His) 5'-end guanylyltransferase